MISRLTGLVVMLWALGFALFVVLLPQPAGEEVTDAIVVLTGGPGRVPRGLDLLERKRAKRLLISGVDRRVRKAELAAEYHVPNRLLDCCVDLGNESVDTRSNAEETAAWVARRRYASVRLVTTDWHMPRARFELSRAMTGDVVILRDAVKSDPGLWALTKEYNKYLLRRAAAPLGI